MRGITKEWIFLIHNDRICLKMDGEWADEELLVFIETPEGAAEIERQYDEYDRRGRPFLSYQKPSWVE